MRKYLVILYAVAVTAAGLSTQCQYVANNFELTDVYKVESCFNSYTLSQDVTDSIVERLRNIGQVYPYVDIARNPPRDPPGYFKVIDYNSELEALERNLTRSGGVISEVVRYTRGFVNGFRDGHFTLEISVDSPSLFDTVMVVLPFRVIVTVADNNERRVFIELNEWTETFLHGETYSIYSKYRDGVYVTDVDGEDAFSFFSELLGEYNSMKSQQGRLMLSFQTLNSMFRLVEYPLDNVFDQFTLTFSDGTELPFNFGFLNMMNPFSVRDSKMLKPKNLINYVTPQREKEFQEFLEHFDENERPSKRELSSSDIKCGTIENMNYLTLPTFDPADEDEFTRIFFNCLEIFDSNDKPITIILTTNRGGLILLQQLVQFLLMPGSDVRSLEAFRKTMDSETLFRNVYASSFNNISNNCEPLSSEEEVEQFLSQEDVDDLGNGVFHTRTKKMFAIHKSTLKAYEKKCLKKHVRKPTDIVVATDGFCFSACSRFVGNCLASGSAIVTGFGVTTPGDEKFVAGQCPSMVFRQEDMGLGTPFTELFPISKDMKETIPLDYSIVRVDKHCGYNESLDLNIPELLKYTTAVYEEFKTKCNPDNQRLLLVDDKCRVDDPNALYSGYACGKNGLWDKSKCKISVCKPGYAVDFNSNKCVPNCCDPREPLRPDPPPVETANNLSPLVAIVSTFVIIMIKALISY